MILLAAALLQEPPLNPGDPIVETGMTSFAWAKIEGRSAGVGAGQDTQLTFFRVSQHPHRARTDIEPYWIVRLEQKAWGPPVWGDPRSVWLDGRRCPAVADALADLAQVDGAALYPPTRSLDLGR